MDKKIYHGTFLKLSAEIEDITHQECKDLLNEIFFEFTNDRWADSSSRLLGIYEAIEESIGVKIEGHFNND